MQGFLKAPLTLLCLKHYMLMYSWFHENGSIMVHTLMNTIYLYHSRQVAGETVFMKHTVARTVYVYA